MYQSGTGMQEVIQMCSSFDSNKSTKGASKLRRDLINGEIANLRDLLPLPSSTRQRLSQLQLMALVCVYVRKANYFQQVFKRFHELGHPYSTPNIGFSKALSGFLIMMTQNGKLLYISDNAAEYLGHSMEDLLIHGDSVYDIIDKADHGTVQAELLRSSNLQNPPGEETRVFLCRMNVSRNARRQMRFGDQKVVLLQGHFLSYLPLCSRNEPVFVATCTPVAMPETRECVVQGATNVFTTIHAMDMKFMHIDRNGEHYLGYTRSELGGISWYQLIHWNYMREAQSKHRLISQSEQEKSCILLLRLQTRTGDWIWIHCVLQVKDGSESASNSSGSANSGTQQQSVIVATNQVLSEREAAVMRANAWLYHYYTVQTKLQYGLAYPEAAGTGAVGTASPQQAAAAARLVAAAAYFPAQQLMSYGTHQPQPHPHHHLHHSHHQQAIAHLHQVSPETPSSGSYGSPTTPHNGTYPPSNHTNPYHYHHSFEMANGGGTKETPLDFSLAAPSMFEFHMGAGNGGYSSSSGASYWSHHHHHHGGGGSVGYTSRLSEGSPSSTVSLSATSPQTWSRSSSMTHQGAQHQQQLSSGSTASTSISNLSPSSSSTGGPSARKRSKRNTEASIDQSASPPSSSNSLSTPRRSSAAVFSSGDTAVATMPSIFPYHARPRSLYKMLGSEDVPNTAGISAIKEESFTIMSCPLTPSPIWEGQTQRVPDLQQFYGDRTDSGTSTLSGTDLIHCVPTYQSYLSYCQPSTSIGNPGNGYGLTGYGFSGYAGAAGSAVNGLATTSSMMMETGSPNKENRLPPTPESDPGENEENRPLKWETL